MKRTKTNFHGIKAVEERWLTDQDIQPGIASYLHMVFITDTLELIGRNIISLQDLRDFAVNYLTTKYPDRADTRHDKLWDCMSAVTHVIDLFIIGAKKMPEGRCPVCGCTELEYKISEFNENGLNKNWKCTKCETYGKEVFELCFIGHKEIYTADNKPFQ